MKIGKKSILIGIFSVLAILPALSQETADSAGNSRVLQEVEVAVSVRRLLKNDARKGVVIIDGRRMGEEASLMASPDAVGVLKSMPAVATSNDLQASISVRGGATGDNRFTSDGAEVINPMHLLGLFSTYNPSYYQQYSFRPGRIPATLPSSAAGVFDARTSDEPGVTTTGSATVGLIESHMALSLPIKSINSSVTIGARTTYLDLLFPKILKLGNSTLKYGFSDFNLAMVTRTKKGDIFKLSGMMNNDMMKMENRDNGGRDGRFGWGNAAFSGEWHSGTSVTRISYSGYRNRFELYEGGRDINLPTTLRRINTESAIAIGTHWRAETDFTYTYASGQYNKSLGRPEDRAQKSWLWNIAASYSLTGSRMNFEAGLRTALYSTRHYTVVIPQPRINIGVTAGTNTTLYAGYGLTTATTRLIQESTGSLPADFWVCAGKDIRPLYSHNFEIGAAGYLPFGGINYQAEAYYRRMSNCIEFAGSLMDLTNSGYNPIDDAVTGNGYAVGISLSLLRQFGAVRGRLSYNLGSSRARMERFGNRWFPLSSDRLHDLTTTLTWQPIRVLTLSTTYTHATGLPYTKAKYGYILSENLICEYFPHNSSRLPSYNRLDAAATITLSSGPRVRNIIRMSVYNILASKNVLFEYTSYNISNGILQKQSVMKSVIPSISYTLQF